MSALQIRLLGRPEIRVNGATLEGLPAKLEALVYYLAISPRSVPRSTLAGLLWSDRSEPDARMNLRAALQKVPPALEPHLVVTREWLALDRNRELDVDVQRFDQAVGALSAAAEGPAKKLERLAEVAALYRDDFLAGFASGHAPEFEAWCTGERSRLRQNAVRLLGETLRLRREAGRDADVVDDARRILQLAPGHDLALRELMEALVRSGQRNAAMEEFERHRRLWREELGIALSEETVRLAERIAAGESLAPAGPGAGAAAVQLVGREREFALVANLLTQGEARIVTVTGMGGIGKTRLAQAVVGEVKAQFADGAMLFSAGAMRSGAALAPALAAGFGLELQARGSVRRALQDYVREKEMLLVFDSFEPVVGTEAVDLLVELVHGAPALRCLVTSRESLGVAEEAVVAIEGLAQPGEDDPAWRDAPAAQLFVQRAMRGYVQFDAERERAGIVEVCRKVEGVPLALELAAALARTLPCAEIARAIERDLGSLARDDAGLSPRHRSLVGVLTCTFNQLAPELQLAIARLAAFRGPFDVDAAGRVAQCSLRQLSMLVEKSWLRRDSRAGYALHDMVRQFAAGQAQRLGVDARDLAQRHGTYFLERAIELGRVVQLGTDRRAYDGMQAILADLHEACEWGVAHGADALLEPALEGTYRYHEGRGDFPSAANLFGELVEILDRQRGARRRMGLARAVCCFGWALAQSARMDEGMPVLERAVSLARAGGYPRILAEALRGLALIRVLAGKPGDAHALLEESLATSRESGDAHNEMGVLVLMGVAVSYLGSGRGQHDYYEQAIALARKTGHARGEMVASFNLGDAHLSMGEFDAAETRFREALALGRRVNNRRHIVMVLTNLASIAVGRGELAQARSLLDEAFAMARTLGERRLHAFLYQGYAEIALAEGAIDEAFDWSGRHIAVADEMGWGWSASFGVALRAECQVVRGEREDALASALDLHARSKDTDFGVHHASCALEAARWLLHFSPRDAAVAAGAVRALEGPLVIDDWVTKRAQSLARGTHLPDVPPSGTDARALMEAMVAVLRGLA